MTDPNLTLLLVSSSTARGVRNVDDGWNLLRDIFLFATLECVAAARYPAP